MNPTMHNQSNMMRSSPRFSLLRCMTACLFLSRCISHVDGFNNVGNSRLPAALMASKSHTQNRSSSAFSTPLESSSLSPSPHSHRPSTSKLFAMQSQSNIHNNGGGVLFPRKQYAISTSRRSAACGTNQKKNAITSFSRSMNLSKLQMTVTSDSSKDNDNDNAVNNGGAHKNPLVKVWLQLRKMFARLWVSYYTYGMILCVCFVRVIIIFASACNIILCFDSSNIILDLHCYFLICSWI